VDYIEEDDDDDVEYDKYMEEANSYERNLPERESRKKLVKGKCMNTSPLTGKKLNIFKAYTKDFSKYKCPCWWDLTKNCACCKGDNSMQCGWPMHKWCYKKNSKGYGCPGVCNNKYTLSGQGFPCHSNPEDKECAWCNKGGFQCYPDKHNGPNSKSGSRCQKQTNQKYCKSVQGDCKHIPASCPDPDRCVKVAAIGKYLSHHECQCPQGYTGNGMQCVNENGTFYVNPDQYVDLTMTLTQEIETFPFTGAEIETGAELQSLITEMGSIETSCSAGDTCSATFNLTEVEN